ncbi:MAG: hypothetical protein GYB31_13320 [Bacteroidetes bacterium]|nr:hypothetical protein [Bacteroidota bacterium]
MQLLKLFSHVIVFALLTLLTQIGGVIYLLCIYFLRNRKWYTKLGIFILAYSLFCFLVLPSIARVSGREPIRLSPNVKPVSWFTVICNRHYVDPVWNDILENVGENLKYEGIQISYMDANFPLFDGYPLIPHLSHNDGEKLDVALIFKKGDNISTNQPGWLGYGGYVGPEPGETNQTVKCKSAGHGQYDITRYLGFGGDKDLTFAEAETKRMIEAFLKFPQVKKIFLEPHLKERMRLTNPKIRFHGCHSVRHDDHIHLQL